MHHGVGSFKLTGMKTEFITSLTQKAAELISAIPTGREPTANPVDVQTYEAMESHTQILEGIAKGEKAIQEGRVVNHDEAKTRLARWLA